MTQSSSIYSFLFDSLPFNTNDKPFSIPTSILYFTPSVTPFSTLSSVSITLITYLTIIFSGQYFMKQRKPISSSNPFLKWPFLIHNLSLSAGSALLLGLILKEILPIWKRNGTWYAVCGQGAWTARLETLYVINYMFKFWELLDTVFLFLKKKPLAFLHVYHHSATALLCFSQLHGKTSVSWVVITLNLFVHVIMYLYYALTSLKINCPWKRYVTICQVIQFIIDLAVVYTVTIAYYLNKHGIIHGYGCAGTETAALAGITVLSSYLVLFIAFYRKTYKTDSSSKGKGKKHLNENGFGINEKKLQGLRQNGNGGI